MRVDQAAALVAARDAAEAAVRARDEFLSIASHELKTPLTSLKLRTQLSMRRWAEQDDVRAAFESCDRQIDRIERLVDDMLDLARIAHGKFSLRKVEADLSKIVAQSIDRLGFPVAFETETGVRGEWDIDRIDQVVVNLLSNAEKYGDGHPITVSVDSEGGNAILRVRDEGKGIASQDLERIFGCFEQSDGTQAGGSGGLGIGLYISRQIVESHGGTLTAESLPGVGSTFTVHLPRSREA